MNNKNLVWIIDSQQWPRAYLRAELLERGLDAAGFDKIAGALKTLQATNRERPHVIIVELKELAYGPEDLMVLADCGIPVILLGGVSELNHDAVTSHKWASILRRPFFIGDVIGKVDELIKKSA